MFLAQRKGRCISMGRGVKRQEEIETIEDEHTGEVDGGGEALVERA